MAGLQDENLNLQLEIQKLKSKLEKKLKIPKHETMNACSSIAPNPKDEVLKALKKRTATQSTEDGVSILFFFSLWNFNIETLCFINF